jgi:quinoprotein glucose dehydrogenase
MQRARRLRPWLLVLGILGLLDVPSSAQAPAEGAKPSTARGEWPTYGGDLASTKYSPLAQISSDNFSSLKIAWRAKSPDGFLSMTLANGDEWAAESRLIFDELKRLDPKRWRDNASPLLNNFKATPLMVNGVLYFNTPTSVGAAVDARPARPR